MRMLGNKEVKKENAGGGGGGGYDCQFSFVENKPYHEEKI